MISIPVGGPGEGQQCVHYGPAVCPYQLKANSAFNHQRQTQSLECSQSPQRHLKEHRLEMRNRKGFTGQTRNRPQIHHLKELPEEAEVEDSSQAADDTGPNDQGAGNPEEPEEGGLPTQKVLNLLDGVSIDLKARQIAVLANIQVSLDSLLQVPVNPYGDVHTTEV